MGFDQVRYAVIGDLVASRDAPDRQVLHDTVRAALAQVNTEVEALEPLAVTVGDEFQGLYATLGDALAVTLRVRLALGDVTDCRCGVGRGATTRLQTGPVVQDGPAWWAAREAIEDAEARASRPASASLRTAYRCAPDAVETDRDLEHAVNAALQCRDHLVGSVSPRSRRLLEGLMAGSSQSALARREGVSASAVSQRVRADGLAVVVGAQAMLEGLA